MIAVDRPVFLYGIALVIPALLILTRNFKILSKNLGLYCEFRPFLHKMYRQLRMRLRLRAFFWTFAWIFLCIAASGPYWGKESVVIQKNSHSVSFVFDVSHSMSVNDVDGQNRKISRLEAASVYARQLLSRMKGISVAVVVTKGNSILSVPMTDDFNMIYALLEKISPQLLTAAGSNLASGLQMAVQAFPRQIAATTSIVFFTDGEETIQSLEQELLKVLQYGINVVIVGFGNTNASEVLTGDGITVVKSALQEQKLQSLQHSLAGKIQKDTINGKFLYINAEQRASAIKILQLMQSFEGPLSVKKNISESAGTISSYETKPIPRHRLFLFLTCVFFACGFFAREFSVKKLSLTFFAVFFMFTLTSCQYEYQKSFEILRGVIYWGQKKYEKAAVSFLQADESIEKKEKPYANFGLASTYLMLNELDAAENIFTEIPEESSTEILFGTYYNVGIIAHRNGDYKRAVENFKQAILIDGNNLNAKINLELSASQVMLEQAARQQALTQIATNADTNAVEEAIFSIIKENDKNQWKNQEQTNEKTSVLDY